MPVRGIVGRLRDGLRRSAAQLGQRLEAAIGGSGEPESATAPDSETLDSLEELLLEADVGVVATDRIITAVRERSPAAGSLRDLVKQEIRDILKSAVSERGTPGSPEVVLVVGVNGTGKTTTVGKLACLLRADGRRPLVCAADTFRAAAVEQLEVWAARANVELVKARSGGDPAAAVFDAVQACRARGCDIVIVDTAGRLHTKTNLMAELDKISRVASREVDGAPHDVLLVLDATVGQNGLAQAREFLQRARVTGVVLTKVDGTAKGGVALAIVSELGLPIRYVGVGETLDDLVPFSAEEYVDGLFAEAW